MSMKSGNNINFYAAYQEATRERRKSGTASTALILLLVLLLALACTFTYVRLQNMAKQAVLDGLDEQIDQLADEHERVTVLGERDIILRQLGDELQIDAALADAFTKPDENLMKQVIACAGDTFNISVFRFNEDTGMLEMDASAPSVNDMPKLVEALRNTGLFETVQYAGYTSDTDGVYYCTVGCVLAFEEEEADE